MIQALDGLRDLSFASILLRLFLSMLLGGVLGLERGRKHRPAGFRTYMLVCIGAALIMMTNQYVLHYFNLSDPVRMGAQVVSGIGFLGAGTIIVTGRNQVKGITTAAGLWTAACGGLAIGIGFYEGAILGGFAVYIVMSLMQTLDDFIHTHSRFMELYLEFDYKSSFSLFLQYAHQMDFDVSDIQISKNKLTKGNNLCATVIVKSNLKRSQAQMLELLSDAPGIDHIERI